MVENSKNLYLSKSLMDLNRIFIDLHAKNTSYFLYKNGKKVAIMTELDRRRFVLLGLDCELSIDNLITRKTLQNFLGDNFEGKVE